MRVSKSGVQRSLALFAVLAMATIAAAQNTSAARSRQTMVMPDGTEIVVRTNETIDSTSATVEKDVTGSNGEVLIPKGSGTELTVNEVSSGGTTGSPELTLGLHSIKI